MNWDRVGPSGSCQLTTFAPAVSEATGLAGWSSGGSGDLPDRLRAMRGPGSYSDAILRMAKASSER